MTSIHKKQSFFHEVRFPWNPPGDAFSKIAMEGNRGYKQSAVFIYPPGNQHIPPMEEENHLPSFF